MPSTRDSIHANRLFPRRRVDLRARLLAPHNGRLAVIYARTVDLSPSGACLTLSAELAAGTEAVLCLRLPGSPDPLCLECVVIRRRGFRAGLRFLRPTAQQRVLLSAFCHA